MAYYDPLYPAYQATRYQIEKTISSLQQKLRRRKELDMQIQNDMIVRDAIVQNQRNSLLISGYPLSSSLRAQSQLRQSLRRLRLFDERGSITNNILQQQAASLDYLQRLNLIRRQRQLLAHDISRRQSSHGYSPVRRGLNQQDEDELVKKYQDGTKLSEYNQELQSKGRSQSHYRKEDDFRTERKQASSGKQFDTPYDKLAATQNLWAERVDERAEKQQISKQEGSDAVVEKSNHSLKPRQSVSPSKSRSRSGPRLNSSQRKITKQLNRSRLRDPDQASSFQQSALKKIENRLIVSSVIYQDSQYRNNKHEQVHLYSTYENEIKIRKEVKQKINTHPEILKKHAMVVE